MQEAEVTREQGERQSLQGLRQTKRPHSEGSWGERWVVVVGERILDRKKKKEGT